MRITGGEQGGRVIAVPKGRDIRPTQDRVREALFDILAPELVGADFLDLFAGSGAVGLEALSRGARRVVFVESNRRHLDVLKGNLAALGAPPDAVETVCADAYRYLARASGASFSIVFADPPYALGETRGYAPVLALVAARNVVRAGGLFIAEMTAAQRAEAADGWELLRDRTYGKTRICIWRREQEKGEERHP